MMRRAIGIVGRDAPADVLVGDQRVSQLHALIEETGGPGWQVRDLGSQNGTFVNGTRVEEAVVTPADELRVGPVVVSWAQVQSHMLRGKESTDLTIGRSNVCDIVLPVATVSAIHALVRVRGDGVTLVDLRSRGGVHVNGSPVAVAQVRPGDRVTIGTLSIDVFGILRAQGANVPGALAPGAERAPDRPIAQPTGPAATTRPQRTRRRLIVGAAAGCALAVLAALFFTGTIWPYWFREYADPWPAAVRSASAALDARGDLEASLERQAGQATELANRLHALDGGRPVLKWIDSWRSIRAQEVAGQALGALVGQFAGAAVARVAGADNLYDGLLRALDRAAPGMGVALGNTEAWLRKALAAVDTLPATAERLRTMAGAVRGYRQSPSKEALRALSEEAARLEGQVRQSVGNLRSLAEGAGNVASIGMGLAQSVASVSETSFGSVIRDQLLQTGAWLGGVVAPVAELQQLLGELARSLEANLGVLGEVQGAERTAIGSDERQRAAHARNMRP